MKNFVLILSTLILITLLVFFYQKSFDKGIDTIQTATEVKKDLNTQTKDLQDTISQINDAFGSLKETSRISNLLKNDRQELVLVDGGDYYIYTNNNLKFEINLDKGVFSNSKDKTFYISDSGNLILVFTGKFNQSEVNLSLLIDKSKTKCDNTGLEKILINDNEFFCGEIATEEKDNYIVTCNLEKNNICFDLEYTITNIMNNKIDDKLKIEDLILKNIVFNK